MWKKMELMVLTMTVMRMVRMSDWDPQTSKGQLRKGLGRPLFYGKYQESIMEARDHLLGERQRSETNSPPHSVQNLSRFIFESFCKTGLGLPYP
jgi:hypothetical protein